MLLAAVAGAVDKTGQEMAEAMRQKMLAGKSGQLYGSHQASAPGEAPANWSGALMDTLESTMTGPTSAEVSAGGTQAPYLAQQLEFGSPGGKIAPRPLVTPTAEEFKSRIVDNVAESLRAALR